MPRPARITPEVQKALDKLHADPVSHGLQPNEPKKKHSSFVQISYNAKQKLAELFKKAFRRK